MAGYIDRSLIHNSSLACFLLATFIKDYQLRTAGTEHPGLDKLLLVLPIVWHGPSRKSIAGRNFATPLHAVISEEPRVLQGLRDRIEAHAALSCTALNLGCQTGLLTQHLSRKEEKVFSFDPSQWPKGSKPTAIPTEMIGTTARLANWFKDYRAAELLALFRVI